MSADDKARKLAEKMVEDILSAALLHRTARAQRYATALLAAEEGLERITREWRATDETTGAEAGCNMDQIARAALATIKGLLPESPR